MSDFCPKCGNHMDHYVCEICSDNFNYELAVELQKENDALRARVGRLEAVEHYLEEQLRSVKLSKSLQNRPPLI